MTNSFFIMKKYLAAFCFSILVSFSVKAQTVVGGSFRVAHDVDYDYTTFTISPEIGKFIKENVLIGSSISYSHSKGENSVVHESEFSSSKTKSNAISFAPYIRRYFSDLGRVKFFAEGSAGISFSKTKTESYHSVSNYAPYNYVGESKTLGFNVGFRPGITFAVCDRLDLLAKIGNIGYSYTKVNPDKGDSISRSSFDCSFSTSNLQFGFLFKI